MKIICPICETGNLKETTKKTCIEFSNPGEIVIESKVQECNKCGETFLDEKESPLFAKKLDKLIKRKEGAKKIKINEGDILLT